MAIQQFEAGKPLLEQLTATRLNAMVAAINASELKQGTGIKVSRNSGGTTISANRQGQRFQPPPFWPNLHTLGTDSAPTYQVSVERGCVIGRIPSAGAAPENREYYEVSNIVDGDGNPKLFDIMVGQALYLTVSMNASGEISAVAPPVLAVYADGSPPSGTSGGYNTVYSFKLCKLESVTIGGFATLQLTRFWCGNNIDLCGRNEDLKVHVVSINSITHFITETSWHTRVTRFGDYIGKFASGDTLPPHVGTLDTDDVTYIGSST